MLLKKIVIFLWKFLHDIIILKSQRVHHPCQHISGLRNISSAFRIKILPKKCDADFMNVLTKTVNTWRLFKIVP